MRLLEDGGDVLAGAQNRETSSVEIQRAGSACARTFHDVEVDHGGGVVGMAEKALDCAGFGAGFKQVRRNGMKDL